MPGGSATEISAWGDANSRDRIIHESRRIAAHRGGLTMKTLIAAVLLLLASSAWGHHSYAMFDGSQTLKVSGTVAKLEWMNPHVFVWLYVPNTKAKDGCDLYAFENGSPGVLVRLGWSRTTLQHAGRAV